MCMKVKKKNLLKHVPCSSLKHVPWFIYLFIYYFYWSLVVLGGKKTKNKTFYSIFMKK